MQKKEIVKAWADSTVYDVKARSSIAAGVD